MIVSYRILQKKIQTHLTEIVDMDQYGLDGVKGIVLKSIMMVAYNGHETV